VLSNDLEPNLRLLLYRCIPILDEIEANFSDGAELSRIMGGGVKKFVKKNVLKVLARRIREPSLGFATMKDTSNRLP